MKVKMFNRPEIEADRILHIGGGIAFLQVERDGKTFSHICPAYNIEYVQMGFMRFNSEVVKI